MNVFDLPLKIHRELLAQLEATPVPESSFDQALRRGGIAYHAETIELLVRLIKEDNDSLKSPHM
jgi:predicted outer membrane protein